MRQLSLATCAIWICVGCVRSEQKQETLVELPVTNARLENIPRGSTSTSRFKIKNVSPWPVTLKIGRTTCSCTSARITQDSVEPEEETFVAVDVNSAGLESVNANVEVLCTALTSSPRLAGQSVFLNVEITSVSGHYGVSPPVVDFGVLRRDHPPEELPFRVVILSSHPPTATVVTKLTDSIYVELASPEKSVGDEYIIKGVVEISPGSIPQNIRRVQLPIEIQVDANELTERFTLFCASEVRHPVDVVPESLCFSKDTRKATFLVQSLDKSRIEIDEVKSNDPFEWSVVRIAEDSAQVSVVLPETLDQNKIFRSELRLVVDYGDDRSYALSVPIIVL